ncbi:hypothetical protein [Nostoc sp.]
MRSVLDGGAIALNNILLALSLEADWIILQTSKRCLRRAAPTQLETNSIY